ncbi:hypothetical protein LTR95_014528 [Oleoguttula sp. CCFEE 5521]
MPDIHVSSITAAGHARLHVGDVHNNVTNKNYQYHPRTRRSDETLREDQRNDTLIKAAAEGQTPRVQYLVRSGADVDHTDEHGLTALHHAVYHGFDDTVTLLIEQGADVNAQSLQSGTPLHLAVLNGRRSTLVALLDARANVNAVCKLFGTGLHLACCAADKEILGVLLNHGGRPQVAQLAESSLVMEALQSGLDELNALGVTTTLSCSPLHIVANCGCLELARMLLATGADVNAVDQNGYSATVYALRYQQFHVAQHLLNAGAVPMRMRLWTSRSETAPGKFSETHVEKLEATSATTYPYAILLHNQTVSDVPYWYWDSRLPYSSETSLAHLHLQLNPATLFRGLKQAFADGIHHLWEETSSVDVLMPEEDILESVYLAHVRLQHAEYCYVYLDDVKSGNDGMGFADSAWFSRPRTVASLFAPKRLEFFARNWASIGTRERLASRISWISSKTLIDPSWLTDTRHAKYASVATKLSWVARTEVDQAGSWAYAVMGLFGVILGIEEDESVTSMHTSWRRLQSAIFRETADYSIFAWRGADDCSVAQPLFADHPKRFAVNGTRIAYTSTGHPQPICDGEKLVATFVLKHSRESFTNRAPAGLVAVLPFTDSHTIRPGSKVCIYVQWSADADSRRRLQRVHCASMVSVLPADLSESETVLIDLAEEGIEHV